MSMRLIMQMLIETAFVIDKNNGSNPMSSPGEAINKYYLLHAKITT